MIVSDAEADCRRERAANRYVIAIIISSEHQIAVTVERCSHLCVAVNVGVDGADQIGDGIGPCGRIGRGMGAVTDGDCTVWRNSQGRQWGACGERHRADSGCQ